MYFYLLLFWLVQGQPPNLIIFLADDLGYNDLGCFGSIAINTPNIDRLASEGMKLTQFYSTAPLCSGSRAALLTGRLPQRSGVYTNDTYPKDLHYRVFLPTSYGSLPATELTIANYLSQENYYTKLIGKWHLGHRDALPTLRGFHSFFGLPYSHEEGFPGPQPESWIFPPVPLMRDQLIIEQPVNLSTLTPKYTQEAINFLNNMSTSHQSFYLHMAYEQPHIPLFASEGWNSNSRRGMYGSVVSEMDASIGVIMNELKILGMNNNTLVIFASDNGAWPDPGSGTAFQPNSISYPFDGGSNAPNRGGKGSTWEGGSHVPAIFWMPSLIPNFSTCMSPILNLDILPTLADLIGFQLPTNRTFDGVSILNKISAVNQCNDRKTDPHVFTYYWRTGLLYAMRYYQYKAHWITRNGFGLEPPIYHSPPLLYNLEWDSGESIPLNSNLTANYYQILKIMEEQYVKITQEIYAEMNQNVAQFNRQDWRIVPCCGKEFNITEAKEFEENGEIGLALWDECVCNLKP